MRLNRSLCLAFLLASAGMGTAHAANLTINRDLPSAVSVIGSSFAADTSTHRAWVVVDYVERNPDQEEVRSERVAVPGLTYDPAARTIQLREGDRAVTCAVSRRVLWGLSFRATPDCSIHIREAEKAADDPLSQADNTHIVIEVGTGR